MIRVKLPGTIEYRDLAIRMVASACKLVQARRIDRASGAVRPDQDFDGEVISAFSEAFNNVVLHSYAGGQGEVEIEIETSPAQMVIRLLDHGKGFDLARVAPPDLDSLPETGLGLYIMRACMDAIEYAAGDPNVLTMRKYLEHDDGPRARADLKTRTTGDGT